MWKIWLYPCSGCLRSLFTFICVCERVCVRTQERYIHILWQARAKVGDDVKSEHWGKFRMLNKQLPVFFFFPMLCLYFCNSPSSLSFFFFFLFLSFTHFISPSHQVPFCLLPRRLLLGGVGVKCWLVSHWASGGGLQVACWGWPMSSLHPFCLIRQEQREWRSLKGLNKNKMRRHWSGGTFNV